MHGFQNKMAQFSSRSSSAIRYICSGRLTVKVTLKGQMIKVINWACPARTSTLMHGFQMTLAKLFSLRSSSVI